MPIRDVEVLDARHPLAVPAGPPGTYNRERRSLFVRIADSEGAVGWGETYALPGVRDRLERLAAALIGCDATEPLPLPLPLPLWPDAIGAAAAGALDIALHDLRGRTLGVPVHQLLGGAVRRRVRVYASGFLYQPDVAPAELWPAEAERLVAAGFTTVKVRIGRDAPAEELRLLEQLRERFPELGIAVDAWGAYSLEAARQVGPQLSRLGVLWFEEPSQPREGYAGYEELAAELGIPLAGGETITSIPEAEALLARGVFDIVQPDAALCGGLEATAVIARAARQHGTRCVPHTWNGAVMAAATLHLVATLAPFDSFEPLLEYDTTENRFIRDVLNDPPALEDGYFAVPDAPGLGIDIDERTLRSYCL